MRSVIFGDANSINVRRWQQGLSSAGDEVYLLSIHIQEATDAHTLPVSVPLRAYLPEKLHYFLAVPAARRWLAQLQPDVVMGYFVTGYGTLAALSGFHPLVQITSGDDILIAPSHPVLGKLVRFNLNRADLTVAWAEHMKRAVQALGIPDSKIFCLPRGIPLDIFSQVQPQPVEPSQPFRLISTRSLLAVYRIDRIIEAIDLLRERSFDCSLTIVGVGPFRADLEALTMRLGLTEQIRFTGWISNDALPSLLAQHHGYISVIDTDGVSASLLEAMAAGVFPIILDNAANRYWIEPGKNGLLLPTASPDAIADAIVQAAHHPTLRQTALGINRALVFERGDLYRNTAHYLQRFRQLVDEFAARSRHGGA